MSNDNIKNILFQDKDIEIDDYEIKKIKNEKVHIIKCHSKNPQSPIGCEKCGGVEFRIKDYYIRKIKHNNLFYNEPCIIEFKQTRFKCLYCNKTVNEITDLVSKSSKISVDLKREIIESCNKSRTVLDVSYSTNTSTTTVNRIYDKETHVERGQLSEIVCIDEFRAPVLEGKLAFIMVDPVSGTIIDILPSRKQQYLYNYFYHIDKEERKKVKYVVTDLCPVYVNVIKEMFPKAKHIADRFHWIRIVVNAVQTIRIQAMKFHLQAAMKETNSDKEYKLRYNDHYKMYKVLKQNYKLLSHNTINGNQEILRYESHIYNEKRLMKNYEILEYIINNDDELYEAYQALQSLYRIAYLSTYEDVRVKLNNWFKEVRDCKKLIGPLKKITYTLEEWETQIVNSFIISEDLGGNMTNGIIEAKNNVSKTLIKMSYGLTSFKNMRAKIMEAEKYRKQLRK